MARTTRKRKTSSKRRRRQWGGKLDVQKLLSKTGIEFHIPGYHYAGPGTQLTKRLARGDPGINRLDKIAKQHDIAYSKAKNLQDKWKADDVMIRAIDRLPGKKKLNNARITKGIGPFGGEVNDPFIKH